VAGIIFRISFPLGALLQLAAFAWALYNGYLQGQTGQSIGKKQAGTRLVSETNGQPIGGRNVKVNEAKPREDRPQRPRY